ncbi:hypothetical protein Pcinc_019887 [Petrolisthes cinctipes]|uniref:Uncharacterized protein n=1 Tax=Petrolisthes cinctipes TaxID=88211 RepID=A0AAE1KH57_PETCI|nr:hypothetical protein Pcinc_019887 [Petrolisthes cinctipes]
MITHVSTEFLQLGYNTARVLPQPLTSLFGCEADVVEGRSGKTVIAQFTVPIFHLHLAHMMNKSDTKLNTTYSKVWVALDSCYGQCSSRRSWTECGWQGAGCWGVTELKSSLTTVSLRAATLA